jgi:ribosomal-protein-alanine N-acetyltransferase
VAVILPVLRAMTADDIPAVAGLEKRTFSDPWSARAFHEEVAAPGRRYLVVEEGPSVVGYGGVMVRSEDAHIMTLGVDPASRRRHLGTRLLLGLVEAALGAGARHLTLEVRPSNTAAIGLYEKFGFAAVGRRPRYYRDEDAVIMWAVDAATEGYRSRLDHIREEL